jgi:hypothetical protein
VQVGKIFREIPILSTSYILILNVLDFDVITTIATEEFIEPEEQKSHNRSTAQ